MPDGIGGRAQLVSQRCQPRASHRGERQRRQPGHRHGTDLGNPRSRPLSTRTSPLSDRVAATVRLDGPVARERSRRILRRGRRRQKVARNKPAALVDSCYDTSLQRITSAAQCAQIFPYYGDARLVSGAPPTDDVFKCALKAVDPADYRPALTPAQLAMVVERLPGRGLRLHQVSRRQNAARQHMALLPKPGNVLPHSIDRRSCRDRSRSAASVSQSSWRYPMQRAIHCRGGVS